MDKNKTTITITFEHDEERAITNTTIDTRCSHRDRLIAAMYLLESAFRAGVEEEGSPVTEMLVNATNLLNAFTNRKINITSPDKE